MKKLFPIFGASFLLAGCASTETGQVSTAPDGTKVYGLSEQPQSNITGVGNLMKPGYDPARVQPSQFTGKEDASDRIGQYPVMPRESTGQEFRRGTDEVTAQGTGAGSLGQTGIRPGPVSASAILSTPIDPAISSAGANPPTLGSAPTLAEPLTSQGSNQRMDKAMGGATSVESGTSTSDNVVAPPSESFSVGVRDPLGPAAAGLADTDLSGRIRETLTTGRAETITRLNPAQADSLEIESVNGNVTLRGPVRSETERLMIGNRVARIEGVRSVNNQLEVVSPTRKEMIDQAAPEARQEPID